MDTQALKLDDRLLQAHEGERGSALVLALLIMILMTLLGLAFVLAGETESKIAVNKRDAEQALFIAEGGVRAVKNWFDAPAGSTNLPVPTISQMNRTLRYVDDNADGTYGPYTSAAAPFNVVYRQGTSDPFERPYRGTPSNALLGTEANPDVRISESGSAAEQTYLATLNASLYPAFPTNGKRARIYQIDVYAPPIILVAGQRTRYGIATLKVMAGVYEFTGTSDERRIATRMAKIVLNELPIPGPLGALQSNVDIDFGGNFTVHWGKVTSTHDMLLPSSLNNKVPSSVPWLNRSRIISRDMDFNGALETDLWTATPDDLNHDGALDFDTWIASANVEDPWLRFWSEGGTPGVGSCTGADCQPEPWYQAPDLGTGDKDHSNIFNNVSEDTFPTFDYNVWKNIAQNGGANVYYYASDGPGTGTYKLNGGGASVSFRTATEGKQGLFFFDTATNSVPVDVANDGTYDNLADDVQISGKGYQSSGMVFLNADFRTTGGGNPPSMTIAAPGEPYIDANGNGQYDSDEYFVDLNYPNAVGSTYFKNAMHRVDEGYTRQVPWKDASTDGKYTIGLNFNGVFYTNGNFDAQGNWAYYGSVITKQGMTGGGGTPDIYFDERLVSGAWPPPEILIPRTIISAFETGN